MPNTKPQLLLAMRAELPSGLLRPDHWDRLEQATTLVSRDAFTSFDDPAAADALRDTEIILASWGCPVIDESVLIRAPKLRLIAYAAASVKYFVTPALFARGVTVTSAHVPMAIPVAEFTVAAIIFCGKDTFRFIDEHRASRGRKGTDTKASWDNPHIGNYGKRVGIVGASRIGRLVIDRLRHFDMVVRVHDPFLSDADAAKLGVEKMELLDLMAWSDIVSLHAPAISTTRHMIGRDQLAAMRDGAYLINTARGWLVDHDALEAEVSSSRLRAFIDTPLPDPLPPESRFYDLPDAVLTPHLAGAQGNELWRMATLEVEEIERYAAGLPPLYPIAEAELDRIA
jgi:phosphoglycerate dehydrogenase-like enzyme